MSVLSIVDSYPTEVLKSYFGATTQSYKFEDIASVVGNYTDILRPTAIKKNRTHFIFSLRIIFIYDQTQN